MVFLKLGLVHELHRVAYHVLANRHAHALNSQIKNTKRVHQLHRVAYHVLAEKYAYVLNTQIAMFFFHVHELHRWLFINSQIDMHTR